MTVEPFNPIKSDSIPYISQAYEIVTSDAKAIFIGRKFLTQADATQLADLIGNIEGLMLKGSPFQSLSSLHKNLKTLHDTLDPSINPFSTDVEIAVKEIAAGVFSAIRTAKEGEAVTISRMMIEGASFAPSQSAGTTWMQIPWFHTNINQGLAEEFLNNMPPGTFLMCGISLPTDPYKAILVRTEEGIEAFPVDIREGNFLIDGVEFKTLEEFVKKSEGKLRFPCLDAPTFYPKVTTSEQAGQIIQKSKLPFLIRPGSKPQTFEINYIKEGQVKNVPVEFVKYGWRLIDEKSGAEKVIYTTIGELFEQELEDLSEVATIKTYLRNMPVGSYTFVQTHLKDVVEGVQEICVNTATGLEFIPFKEWQHGKVMVGDTPYDHINDFIDRFPEKFKIFAIMPAFFESKIRNRHQAEERLLETGIPYLFTQGKGQGNFKLYYISATDGIKSVKLKLDPDLGWIAKTNEHETKGYPILIELFENEFLHELPIPAQARVFAHENDWDEELIDKIPLKMWHEYEKYINQPYKESIEPPHGLIQGFREALNYDSEDVDRILNILDRISRARLKYFVKKSHPEMDEPD